MTFTHFHAIVKQPVADDDNSSFRDSEASSFSRQTTQQQVPHLLFVSFVPYVYLRPLHSPPHVPFDTNENGRNVGLHAADDEGGRQHHPMEQVPAGRPARYFPHRHTDRSLHQTDAMDAPCDAGNSTHVHYDSPSFRGIKICVL